MKPAATSSSASKGRDENQKMKAHSIHKENRKPPPSMSNKTKDAPLPMNVFSSVVQDQCVTQGNADVPLPVSTRTLPLSSQNQTSTPSGMLDKVKKVTITWTDDDSHEMTVWNEPNKNIGTSNSNNTYNIRWCGIITNVYHAWKCPFNDSSGGILATRRCATLSGCRAIKDLYQHIQTGTCNSLNCMYGNLCREATEATQHFKQCKSESCPICGPVVRHIPFMNRAIEKATETSHREVAMLQRAQCIIMSDIVDIYNANHHSNTEPTSVQQSLSVSSSPSVPRVIGITNRSTDDSIGMMVQGPPKKRFPEIRHTSSK